VKMYMQHLCLKYLTCQTLLKMYFKQKRAYAPNSMLSELMPQLKQCNVSHNNYRESKGGYKIEVSDTSLKADDNIKSMDPMLYPRHERITITAISFRMMLHVVTRVLIHR
jgi:hypothetical protein